MKNEINQMDATSIDCAPSCVNEEPVEKPEPKWGQLADSFLMIAFAVGVYSQIFAFFLYAFTTNV